ncbi:hypothetical protein [Rhabdothermincola sp.]|uniref:hypothetical protein n=1 Tax=Rhabdothermincola sp. TaxID=2820405 RepID=UPI002FE0E272
MQRLSLKHPVIVGVVVLGSAAALVAGRPIVDVAVAAVIAYLVLRVGVAILGGLAHPLPEPPPPGELRKVKITYRCTICGAEVRMTIAPAEDPEPPRHCQEDMELVAPID